MFFTFLLIPLTPYLVEEAVGDWKLRRVSTQQWVVGKVQSGLENSVYDD